MRMMRCKAAMQIHVTGTDTLVELGPPMEVDFDRILRPAKAAKGTEGQPDYQPAVSEYTLADAVAGREDCFEPVPAPAPSLVVPANPRAAASADASEE